MQNNLQILHANNHTKTHDKTLSGTEVSIDNTVNHSLDGIIKGKTELLCDWYNKTGLFSQSGTPSPSAPVPITSNLPAGTYRVQDYLGDWYEFTLAEDLGGIGDVLDSVEWDRYTHTGYVKKKCAEKIFDGTGNIGMWNDDSTYLANGSYGFYFYPISGAANLRTGLLCSHFKPYLSGYGAAIGYIGSRGATETITFNVDRTQIKSTSEFKAWITGVVLVYQLATPTRTALTFTKNNASTATICSMEFLTSTPSVEYPAQLYSVGGNVITSRNSDNTKSSSITLPVLRSVNDDVTDTYDLDTGKKTQNASDWVTLDEKTAQSLNNYNGFKRLNFIGVFDVPFGTNTNLIGYKYDGTILNYGATYTSSDVIQGAATDIGLRISVKNGDSGWSDAYSPSIAECKAYFYGWKMCHSDGASPYYKSEIPYTPETWAKWSKNNAIGDSSGMELTANGTSTVRAVFVTSLKVSTKYGVLFNVVSTTATAHKFAFNLSTQYGVGTSLYVDTVGNVKHVFTTAATINNLLDMGYLADTAGNKVKFKDIRLYELPTGSQIETDFDSKTGEEISVLYPFYGLNPKNWKHVTDGLGLTSTLPTASYDGYTSYKMMYQLATPVTTQLNLGGLSAYERHTIVEQSGIVLADMELTAKCL